MSKILELADAYAHATWGESDEKHEARSALVAEVEKLEAENAKLKAANDLMDSALLHLYPRGCTNGAVFELWNAARAALGEK